jgi:hypothetical protein
VEAEVSALSSIRKGRITAPLKALVYGVEGIGKSTLGAGFPAPLFLCAESGTERLDVARLPEPKTWAAVLADLDEVATAKHEYQTLVVDTVDWLEPLVWDHVCAKNKWASIEAPGYGKGYVEALGEWRGFLKRLESIRARGIHVVLLAHATVRRVSPPDLEPFDRYALKVNEKAAALVREWVDAVLFAQYEVSTAKGKQDRVAKAYSTGERVLRTVYSASWDAKNRWGLPETVPLDARELLRLAAIGEPMEAVAPTEPSSADDPRGYPDELDVLLDAVGDADYAFKVNTWLTMQGRTPQAYREAIIKVRGRAQKEVTQ